MRVTIQTYSQVVFTFTRFLFAIVFLPLYALCASAVSFERVPQQGIQPQVATDASGRVHLLYFKGDPMGGDIFYATKTANHDRYSEPLKVNSTPNSVLVAGTMRGPQLSLGRDGRAHVVWMGGNGAVKAQVGDQKVTPLLYARMNDERSAFEPERNILTHIAGLDGGQTVAADDKGNVYVIWHGAPPNVESEEERGLYVAHSRDDGKTFAAEFKGTVPRKGACACCGIRAKIDDAGALNVLFRSAEEGVNRAELWLQSTNQGKTFAILQEDPWKTATCPASSANFAFMNNRSAGAWETDNKVVAVIRSGTGTKQVKPTGKGKQKHPTVALNSKGEMLMTWVEDAGWGTPGTLVCQLFDETGNSLGEPIRKPELPAWSFGAPYADANGTFVVLY